MKRLFAQQWKNVLQITKIFSLQEKRTDYWKILVTIKHGSLAVVHKPLLASATCFLPLPKFPWANCINVSQWNSNAKPF